MLKKSYECLRTISGCANGQTAGIMPEKKTRKRKKGREGGGLLINIRLAAVPALLVAIGQVYVTGVDGSGSEERRPSTF